MPAGRRFTTCCAGRFSSTAVAPPRKPQSAAREAGGRILEIGVGTGLSFDDYDATTEITGIDMSEPMIARARVRAASGRYPFVKGLCGDGCARPALRRRQLRLRGRRSSSSRWWTIPSACSPNARACSSRADRSSWSIIFILSAGLRPRSSACWRRRRDGWACARNFRSRGWPPGRRTWRCRTGRAAQGQAVRRLHAGAVPPRDTATPRPDRMK